MTKFIFITGGVVSGLGKGITAASLARLLKMRGVKVAAQKLDPYMNVDPGTMSPFQHGEVFVTGDGAETDLDLGHYERFIDDNLTKFSNLTSGRVYQSVLDKERRGDYLGKTVQVIPHVTAEIKQFIYDGASATNAEVLITEIGGTTGDIESQPFLEAIRQINFEVGPGNALFIHVTLVPYIQSSAEHKSKPTQHSVKGLQSFGISPDIIVTRSDSPIGGDLKEKIALFCNVTPECVIENITLDSLYEVPMMLYKEGIDKVVCEKLGLKTPEPDLSDWEAMLKRIADRKKRVRIAIVGKYVRLHDAYLSVTEALAHAGFENNAMIDIAWVDSEKLDDTNAASVLSGCAGILVPGGFGERGISGMITACKYARENHIPYFGICLGMQVMVIEFARNVAGLKNANSTEFDTETKYPVIGLMPDQHGVIPLGGTLRLGSYPCALCPDTTIRKAYHSDMISERHRHRYEFNNDFRETLVTAGLIIGGLSPDGRIVEAVELPGRDFFVGVQFHPEFLSRPNRSHPLFASFISAAVHKTSDVSQQRDYASELRKRTAFIKDVLKSANATGIVFGNSGGKDSALVGILCKKACENTLGVMMPCGSKRNFEEDMRDALEVAEKYGIETRTVNVTPVKDALTTALGGEATLGKMALANINPRVRMTTLYAIAATENRLVAGTGNRSETYMGYFTKWGDGAYDFNPIADLTVTEIYEFLRFLQAPSSIIEKAPSAALFEGQTDEDEMGISYSDIDDYLLNGKATADNEALIERFHSSTGHKRRMPLVYPGDANQ